MGHRGGQQLGQLLNLVASVNRAVAYQDGNLLAGVENLGRVLQRGHAGLGQVGAVQRPTLAGKLAITGVEAGYEVEIGSPGAVRRPAVMG
jgi:hypothetical protein